MYSIYVQNCKKFNYLIIIAKKLVIHKVSAVRFLGIYICVYVYGMYYYSEGVTTTGSNQRHYIVGEFGEQERQENTEK